MIIIGQTSIFDHFCYTTSLKAMSYGKEFSDYTHAGIALSARQEDYQRYIARALLHREAGLGGPGVDHNLLATMVVAGLNEAAQMPGQAGDLLRPTNAGMTGAVAGLAIYSLLDLRALRKAKQKAQREGVSYTEQIPSGGRALLYILGGAVVAHVLAGGFSQGK